MENNTINYGRNLSWISFNGKKTNEFTKYPLFIQTRPTIQIPERDIELIEIPGRSGSLVYDKKRFKNVTKTYYISSEIDSYEDNENSSEINYIDRANEIIKWLVDGVNDYAELIESYSPNIVYMARLDSQETMIESVRDGAIVLQVTFTCKPYKYISPADVYMPDPEEYEQLYPCYRTITLSYLKVKDYIDSSDVTLICSFDSNSFERLYNRRVSSLEDDNNYMLIKINNSEKMTDPFIVKINLGYFDFLVYNQTTQLTISLTDLIAYTDGGVNLTDKMTIEQGTLENVVYDSNTTISLAMYGPSYNISPIKSESDRYDVEDDPDDPDTGYTAYSRIKEDITNVKIVFRGEYL